MAEPTALSVIIEPIALVFHGLARIHWIYYLSRLGKLLVLPLWLLSYPIAFIFRILVVVCSPIIYPVSYVFSWTRALLGYFSGLEALYTFFGVAAFIGIISGLILALFSSFLTATLDIQDDGPDTELQWSSGKKVERYTDGEDGYESSKGEGSSSSELDWPWFETSPTKRPPVTGLISQTIHEEVEYSD